MRSRPVTRLIGLLGHQSVRARTRHRRYTRSVDVFELYRQDLLRRDIEPATRERYAVVAGSFRSWLAGREPSSALAEDFLAHLREQGYRQRSILLYYHVVRQVLALKGETLELRLMKPRDLPNWYDGGYRAPPSPG